ncbi:MAG: hypothetical protein KAR00_00450 [Candidatus Pacebacteria bacterium]|nr:hypothetical protein [Candidatus Paceibacterota bacterium]
MDAETIRLIYYVSLVTNVVCDGLAGIFLFFTAYRKARSARMFANMSFALVFWSLTFFIALTVPTVPISAVNTLIQISYIGLAFAAVFFLDFCLSFVEERSIARYRWPRRIGYFLALTFSFLFILGAFTEVRLVLAGTESSLWFPLWGKAGPLYGVYLIYFLGLFSAGFYYLLSLWFKTTDTALKKQISLIFWMTVIPALGGSTQYLIVYKIPVFPVGAYLIPVYVFGLLYAITRFHLFNVKVITAEVFTITIWMALAGKVLFVQDITTLVLDLGVLFASIIFGLFAIRSILNEARQKEHLEDLNDLLEEKVAKQTREIRKSYEVEKKARIELEELDKSKDQFILTTQHHLRTPLTIAKGYLELLQRDEPRLSPKGKEYLSQIDQSVERMKSLVSDFLNVSQLEVGKAVLEPLPLDIYNVLSDIYKELKADIVRKHLSFELRFSPKALQSKVMADKRVVRAAFYNLVDNAVKYTEKGGIRIVGEIFTHPIEKLEFLRVSIIDTGIGIDTDELPRIFNRYFERGVDAEKIFASGKGLGLSISKNMIQLHSGKILVDSHGKGKGSTFMVELPIIFSS